MTTLEWQNNFGNRLRTLMKEQGVTQNRLARDSGLSTSRINDYVKGRSVPTVYALIKIAYALDTTPGKLADFNERIRKTKG